MRVLHVMRMTGLAGSENHLKALIPELREFGWESDLMIPTPEPGAVREVAREFAELCGRVIVVPTRFDGDVGLVARIAARMRSGRYDLVHTHLVHADWHGALASLAAPGVPLVSSKHNANPFRTKLPFRVAERAVCNRCAEVITISDALRGFTERWTAPRVPVTPILYGLHAPADPAPRSDSPTPTLLAVARLIPQKGIDVLLRAMPRVDAAVPGTRLMLAGDGASRAEFEALARELGIDHSVEFLGYRRDVAELMRSAWLMVHPARWEGFGLVFLEAMRERLPIVATAVGPVPEIVDDQVGRLVEPDDPDALADAIVAMLQDPDARRSAGTRGFARLTGRFAARRMARQTAEAYWRSVG